MPSAFVASIIQSDILVYQSILVNQHHNCQLGHSGGKKQKGRITKGNWGMDDAEPQYEGLVDLPILTREAQPTVSDQVFSILKQRIITLDFPPTTKISESEVADMMGVSRQPVREAFQRLAKLGFLKIKPQSGTTVSLISEQSILRARFIRKALEMHTCRVACEVISQDGLNTLASLIKRQEHAVAATDRDLFHELDEEFHQEICIQAGVGYVWDVIQENKGHLDRLRILALPVTTLTKVLEEHKEVLECLSRRNPDKAADAMTRHLSRALILLEQAKAEKYYWFED